MEDTGVTVEKVMENPNAFGMPSFEQFAQDPDKYRDSVSKRMARFDQSSQVFKHLIEKQTYKIAGYEVKSLEQVERIAKEEGIDLNECKFVPQVIPTGGGKCKIVVEFRRQGLSRILDFTGRPFAKKAEN